MSRVCTLTFVRRAVTVSKRRHEYLHEDATTGLSNAGFRYHSQVSLLDLPSRGFVDHGLMSASPR
jgi:hypothetical protein